MKIRMYNCGFGDCFQIDDNSDILGESRLLVDYGWAKGQNSPFLSCYSQLLSVINDKTNPPTSFLLTHYHEDHYCGLCYQVNELFTSEKIKFKDVYIPDVWDADSDQELVALLLLSDLKNDSSFTLIDFLLNILRTGGQCHFVKKGSIIENRYRALWPDKAEVSAQAKSDFTILFKGNENKEFADEIINYAAELINIVSGWNEMNFGEIAEEIIERNIQSIKDKVKSAKKRYEIFHNKKAKIDLPGYGNNPSIVFHSLPSSDHRILFTGDIPPRFHESISESLLDSYVCIKIPHHGTSKYYWNDLNDHIGENAKLLISNGHIANESWYIYFKYAEDCNTSKTKYQIICSEEDSCPVSRGCGKVCMCANGSKCIGPAEYEDIFF